ncbi:hypothetical protein [Nocardia seriolae]|nr:hypothetical protein [Nocardia seriolae]APB01412.1 hypothetical protein NS506_07392 [Nocardia seriolae]MTJ61094.1 hypothetical protein [Nocardia seriolae]MTJ75975.1 hypothetical protein [Nocardia seriolae]MTJ90773.1 hypothetical protein [Nocardia seriolae]MTK34732.1 hypothetical protein [Nocardia seriolae]
MIWFGRRPCRCWLWEPNRLAEHGTGWQHELDAARRRHARVLLTDPDLTQRSIAGRLGYNDTRSPRRALARWSTEN